MTALHKLAEHCSYGNLHDEMIRDRLVVGLQDAKVSLKLQMDPELTLKNAVITASQSETVRKQQLIVRPSEQPPNIDQVISKPRMLNKEKSRMPKGHICTRCGKTPPHSRQECPAREATCYKCSKKGHFSTVCRSTGLVRVVQFSGDTHDITDNFLGAVETCPPTIVNH